MTDHKCPIFNTTAVVRYEGGNDLWHVNSDRAGGRYIVSGDVINNGIIKDDLTKKIARWIYEQNQLGETPKILMPEVERIKARASLTVSQRAEALLQLLENISEDIAHIFRWRTGTFDGNEIPEIALAATESSGDDEVIYFLDFLEGLGFTEQVYNSAPYFRISPSGYSHLETVPLSLSKQVFVAMWFNDDVKEAYEKGIEPAIYDTGYTPRRIDRVEHNNKIDDEIIAEIRKSKFLIADFTSGFIKDADVSDQDAIDGAQQKKLLARGGVYYEAGFAQGLGLPVIWTCRKDCLPHIHFDTQQYNHIEWKTPEELREKLKNRIEATII